MDTYKTTTSWCHESSFHEKYSNLTDTIYVYDGDMLEYDLDFGATFEELKKIWTKIFAKSQKWEKFSLQKGQNQAKIT